MWLWEQWKAFEKKITNVQRGESIAPSQFDWLRIWQAISRESRLRKAVNSHLTTNIGFMLFSPNVPRQLASFVQLFSPCVSYLIYEARELVNSGFAFTKGGGVVRRNCQSKSRGCSTFSALFRPFFSFPKTHIFAFSNLAFLGFSHILCIFSDCPIFGIFEQFCNFPFLFKIFNFLQDQILCIFFIWFL